MKCPTLLPNESERLQALTRYGFEQEQMLKSLDPVVQIASHMFAMPVAAVNMIGSDHVFFAAAVGVGDVDMRRDVSFCAHAINQSEVMVVSDTRRDERFFDNPLVTGDAQVRFYAGVPLRSPDGFALGALCILDHQPHPEFSPDDAKRLAELAKMASDRLELRRIEVASTRFRPPFATYAGNLPSPVIWFDEHLQLLEWNQAAADLLGFPLTAKTGLTFDRLLAAPAREEFCGLIAKACAQSSLEQVHFPEALTITGANGLDIPIGLVLLAWQEEGRMTFEVIFKDASHPNLDDGLDGLTGLANRGTFYRRVESHLLQSPPDGAVLVIDLDGFKDLNDTLGQGLGDDILRAVATRLTECVGKDDLVARMGADEFAILSPQHLSPAAALSFAQQLTLALAQPLSLNQEVRISACCGLALAPQQAQEAIELVSNADLALCKAKTCGPGRAQLFDPNLRKEAVSRRLYGLELHRAVDRGEFLLFYQPQINMADGSITGAEALIRWRHPERGLLSPASFIHTLENGPLAATVGSWVLNEACAQAAHWRRIFNDQLRIGINLCGAQFYGGGLTDDVLATLSRHGLPAAALELEVTENIVLANADLILENLQLLRACGIGIAFDDFGTGYASLSLLKTYPLSRLKIDQSFVRGIATSKRDASVVRAILDMARDFELETIAEGIETDAELHFLQREHCTEGQGYLFGKPMSARQFETLLSAQQPANHSFA